ncbi:MAG: c-type cytochrome [Pseudomonadota bacterium]
MEEHVTSDEDLAKTMSLVLAVLVVFFFMILAAANLIVFPTNTGPNSVQIAAMESRIAPVGKVRTSADDLDQPVAEAAPSGPLTGEQLVANNCLACHGAAVAAALGAPAAGDAAAWASRLGAGIDTLVNNAINGIGAMPPRGGSALSDDEIRLAVEFLVGQ